LRYRDIGALRTWCFTLLSVVCEERFLRFIARTTPTETPMKHRSTIMAFALAAVLPATAGAQTTLFANMTHDQELVTGPLVTNPGGQPRPLSFGFATFLINAEMTQMTMNATVFNIDITGTQTADLNDNLTAAHIHGSANPFIPPATAGVIWGFFGLPDHDNNPKQLVVTPFANGVGGTFTSVWDAPEATGGFAAHLPTILAGRSYINFHTTQFGGGEIRGAIVVTPEPSSFLLMAAGLGAVTFVVRRRRRQL
jgi:hypothetical protein